MQFILLVFCQVSGSQRLKILGIVRKIGWVFNSALEDLLVDHHGIVFVPE